MSTFLFQKRSTPASCKFHFIVACAAIFSFAFLFCIKSSSQDLSGSRNNEIAQYLRSDFTNKIISVTVKKNDIVIEGSVSPNQGNLYLCELRMFDETKLVKDTFASVTPIDSRQSTFSIQARRFTTVHDTGYDRVYSRWVIASKNGNNYQLQSFAHYADDITDVEKQYLPEEKPVNKKGLAGFAVAPTVRQDFLDLGIKNVTVNIVLTNFVSLKPTAYTYTLNGQTYYFNPTYVNHFEQTIKFCTDNNVFVTGLVLIPRNLSGPLKTIFMYPKSNNGVFSIANITSVTGLNYYAAVVGFLAERYSRPDKKFGRITNWVVHNEVDNGYYWTNAGPAEIQAYTELYDRSMRTVYYTIRQYNPTGKVLLCLTHFWSKTSDSKNFPPKNMLDLLNRMSNSQGDYEWGIAYHPYPQNLQEPKTWADKDANPDLNNAAYITPKNIELLDAWVCMRSHLYKNLKVRTLMFTEQGIHSKSYNREDLLVQAAGVAYMWKKINRLPSLEAFDYHGQVDNLHEHGLRVGLWTVKSGTQGAPGEKKPSWFIYQKAGTSSEDSAFAFALPIIGIKNWPQIFNPLNEEAPPVKVTFNVTNGGASVNDVSVYFNGEMRKTINGKAIFYNVAALSRNRNYRLMKNGQLIHREQEVVINKDQVISVDIGR
jgi:hypothetical protein